MTFHTEQAIRAMCKGLEIIRLRESHTSSTTPSGLLNGHRFDVIVRKPSHPLAAALS
ncbi:hypothetical protein [Pseudomonas sp. MF6747]|uniref:hypothetical protein n=1 Tax=Pseudomonas sp. MF6747 TaxID=2797527 RepID=UPI00190CC4A5|nr:hypothetical protein [Pseudomonas sp. MF6747]MBK3510973.1 hypothetical protein [Pseudomonas sp. MF6747]